MKILITFAILCLAALIIGFRLAHAGAGPQAGAPAPEFTLPDQEGRARTLAEFGGKWLVLYFYPKDDTPGCTQEACTFRDDLIELRRLDAQVVGVSVDDAQSHAAFARKYGLPFPLLADRNGEVAARYGALRNLGVVKFARRYTYLIDPSSRIAKIYHNVDTSRHSKEIIEDLKKLTGS